MPQETETTTVPIHPKHPEGEKRGLIRSQTILMDQKDACLFGLNEEITLMSWGNCIIRSINKKYLDVETKGDITGTGTGTGTDMVASTTESKSEDKRECEKKEITTSIVAELNIKVRVCVFLFFIFYS